MNLVSENSEILLKADVRFSLSISLEHRKILIGTLLLEHHTPMIGQLTRAWSLQLETNKVRYSFYNNGYEKLSHNCLVVFL